MEFADTYFKRHLNANYDLQEPPSGLLCFCVVIPVFLEENLEATLLSIEETLPVPEHIEVILVFNYSEAASSTIKKQVIKEYESAQKWCKNHNTACLKFFPLLASNLPAKHAGVGLARKIGMDTALKRFASIGRPEGVIVSLDADTRVEPNYFQEISNSFYHRDDKDVCILYFEHPTAGNEFPDSIYTAIVQYELYLRYYKHILKAIGFNHVNYTIGSCFGVRADVYARHGGMNRQQAGEDFYFLNKLFPHVNLVNLTETCVYPSPRPSERVVFGTGPVVHQLSSGTQKNYYTYSPESFLAIQQLIKQVPQLYSQVDAKQLITELPTPIANYMDQVNVTARIKEIRQNTADSASFRKRFFLWFDGFQVVKYLNYAHTTHYEKIPVEQAVNKFLFLAGEIKTGMPAVNLLRYLRELDKKGKHLIYR